MQSANYDSPITVQGNSTSGEPIPVGGAAAGAAATSGNPVKIGGVNRTTLPTYTNGQQTEAHFDTRGGMFVVIKSVDGTNSVSVATPADGQATSSGLNARAENQVYNGTTWDMQRGNTDLTILASAARTATNQSADIVNYNGRGMHLVIDVTAASATPSVVFTIQGKDALSGKYYTILASSAITGTGTTVLKVCPGITAAANASVSDLLPRTWRIDATHADADSITYSVGASVIL